MIVLFTDFGWQDPYVGQLKAVLTEQAPATAIIDLLHGVPDFNAHAGAHLLAALSQGFPERSVFLCVVDPGVGGERAAIVLEADGRYFVGPDNGLLTVLAGRARQVHYWTISWRPEPLSATFHGRDLFAPVAAKIATQSLLDGWLQPLSAPNVQFEADDLPRVIYLDHYGNAWTGLRGEAAETTRVLSVAGRQLVHARTFSEVEKGTPFWYVNSSGMVEIAVNRASAVTQLGLKVGDLVRLSGPAASHLH
jgi:S-adenosylmethionine hydrolase